MPLPKIILSPKEIKLKIRGSLISAIIYGTASIFTQVLMMIYLIIIARWLGAEKYVYIAAANAATALSAFLFNWGFNEWLMKAGTTRPDIEELGGSVLIIKIFLGFVWGFCLWGLLRLIRPELYLSNILILTILEVWFDSVFGTLLAILILKSRIRLASVLLTFSRLLRLLAVISLILLGLKSVEWVLILRLFSTLIFFILAWIFAKPKLFGKHSINTRELFRSSSAFNISELLNLIFLHADVNILSWLGSDLELIANYSIVISLIKAIITLPNGIFNVILPNMIKAYKNLKAHFYRYIRLLYAGFMILGIVLWLGALYLSKPIITTFLGETYVNSIEMLILLSPLLALRTINQANIAYLVAVGCQTRRLLPQLITVIVKVVAGLIVVSQIQPLGIIFVTIGTEILLFCGYLIQIVRHYINPQKMECYENLDDHL